MGIFMGIVDYFHLKFANKYDLSTVDQAKK